MTKDPVCGMKIDEEIVAATSVYKGETYYFCKSGCKELFDQNPEKRLEEGPMGMLGMMREFVRGIFKG